MNQRTAEPALQRTVVRIVPKGVDRETHVSLIDVSGEKLVEVADFILSKEEYGRGYHVPVEYSRMLADALFEIANRETVS